MLGEDGGAGCRNAKEKLNLLLESQKVTAENEGEWLRQNGLHTEHLTLFKQDLSEIVANKTIVSSLVRNFVPEKSRKSIMLVRTTFQNQVCHFQCINPCVGCKAFHAGCKNLSGFLFSFFCLTENQPTL